MKTISSDAVAILAVVAMLACAYATGLVMAYIVFKRRRRVSPNPDHFKQ